MDVVVTDNSHWHKSSGKWQLVQLLYVVHTTA